MSLRLDRETAVETAAFFSLGMRRISADLSLIRMLIYYGSAESPEPAGYEEAHEHAHAPTPSGRHPLLAPMAMRILDADPSFSYAALYASGAIAFNLDRPEEALRLLEYAMRRDPRNTQYHAYAAAIGFHKKGDVSGVQRLMEPVLEQPDCPTMIKHMMAYLYWKTGRRQKAIALYRQIRDLSRDEGYRKIAERALAELSAKK